MNAVLNILVNWPLIAAGLGFIWVSVLFTKAAREERKAAQ